MSTVLSCRIASFTTLTWQCVWTLRMEISLFALDLAADLVAALPEATVEAPVPADVFILAYQNR